MCSIINGTSHNLAVSSLINMVKDSMPVIHACPYEGKIDLYNVTNDSTKVPSFFPSGIYRSRVRFYDDKDTNIYSLITYITCKSVIKTSF